MSPAARLLAGVAVGFALAGCHASVSVGTKTVDKGALGAEVQSQLSKTVGKQAPPVTCPTDLAADVGATTTCTMTDSAGTYDVTVTVTSVEDGTAKFDIQVADEPNP